MMTFSDAFISYGRADSKAFAIELQARLSSQGLRVWFDFNDIPLGVDFQNQIDDGIEKAHSFLFIIAPHSVNSPYCLKEIELAIKRNKRIIPLLHVEQIDRQTWQQRNPKGTDQDWETYKGQGKHTVFQNMHPTIGKINWVYFREGLDDFEKSLADLITLLGSHADYVEQHTRLLAKALEWSRHQKQTSYLLTAEERQQGEAWLKIRFKNEQPPCTPADIHCEFITESIKNANNLMTQVFLSYATQDKGTMEKIRNSLRREGITVWTNTTDIQTGEEFDEAINRGIEQADNLVYLLSPDSVKSTSCQQELDYADELNKRIIPVLVRETDPTQVPTAQQKKQYIDLTDNVREEDYLLDESQLLKILQTEAAYYNEHKILLTKALKWQGQQKNPSILLRGYNLQSAETWLKVALKRRKHRPTPLQEEFIAESQEQPPLESLDVFIAYAPGDSDLARKLNDSLQVQGKTTWFEQESIAEGKEFKEEIYRGIKVCDNFLFILSPSSVNDPDCQEEVEYAASLNKRFVTVLNREVNTRDLPGELAEVQWLDFHQHKGDFNANFNQLVRTLDTDREHLRSHTKWLQRAWEWDQKSKSDDLLLRGSECIVARDWLQSTEEQQKKPAATTLQKEFIEASQKAIEAERKREEERTKELEKVIEEQIKYVSRLSSTLNNSDRKFDALVEGIRAGALLKNLTTIKPEIQEQVLTNLQSTVYAVREKYRERNRLIGHKNSVITVAFSPDGQTIATASSDKTAKLWNRKGQLLHSLVGHEKSVITVAFSPDGQTIATASSDKTVKLWNRKGQLLHSLVGHEDEVWHIAFSPDGQTIATASSDKTIKLWNRKGQLLHSLVGHEDSGAARSRDDGHSYTDIQLRLQAIFRYVQKMVSSPKSATGHEDGVIAFAFSRDGQTIASASSDKTVKLWNREGQLLHSLVGHENSVINIAFSRDGQTIASASSDKTVKLWNRKGQLLHSLVGHEDWVIAVAFSPDGQTIATASKDKTVKLWNGEGQLLHSLVGHENSVINIAFSPDGQTIASASWDKTVKLWNQKGQLLHSLVGYENSVIGVASVAFSPDGQTIAFASWDKTVKLWNQKGQLLHSLVGHEDWVINVAFSPDGQTIATASTDKTVKLWNRKRQLLYSLVGHENSAIAVAFSPDGQTIASASWDKTVKLWNRKGQLLHSLVGHEDRVIAVAFSPDGQTIASASKDKTVKLWNQKGQLLHSLVGHENSAIAVAFSPDGQTIATASKDKTVKLWNQKGQLLHSLVGHENSVLHIAFSPDGQTIATASSDKTVKLWNQKGQLLHSLVGHENSVLHIAFSSDSHTIATASKDFTIKLWNRKGQLLHSLEDHEGWVNRVAFSPDGQIIASASDDFTVKLWNRKGQLLHSLVGHEDEVIMVAFSPDGQTIASASKDKTVILWKLTDLTLDSLMQHACAWVGDYLKYNAPEGDKNLCEDY